jgi:hypothetical protein
VSLGLIASGTLVFRFGTFNALHVLYFVLSLRKFDAFGPLYALLPFGALQTLGSLAPLFPLPMLESLPPFCPHVIVLVFQVLMDISRSTIL